MRLPRLPFIRSLAALAIAIASPGLDVSHGLAHDHDHDAPGQAVAHHDRSDDDSEALHVEDLSPDHAHQTVSEALGVRPVIADVIATPTPNAAEVIGVTSAEPALPGSGSTPSELRSTGPPPSLRAPPRS